KQLLRRRVARPVDGTDTAGAGERALAPGSAGDGCAAQDQSACRARLDFNESGFEGDVFVSREANGLAPTCSGWPATPHKAEQSRTSRRDLQNTYVRCPLRN